MVNYRSITCILQRVGEKARMLPALTGHIVLNFKQLSHNFFTRSRRPFFSRHAFVYWCGSYLHVRYISKGITALLGHRIYSTDPRAGRLPACQLMQMINWLEDISKPMRPEKVDVRLLPKKHDAGSRLASGARIKHA